MLKRLYNPLFNVLCLFGEAHSEAWDKGTDSDSEEEINYCCLYAIGLKGKEVGAFLNLRSHNKSRNIPQKNP